MNDHVPDSSPPVALTSSLLEVLNGFFTREGGVSPAPYDSLNGGINTGDAPENVAANRARVAEKLGVKAGNMPPLRQVHGVGVLVIRTGDTPKFDAQTPFEGDAVVSANPAWAAAVATADCAPVLMMSGDGAIVGAAHAGWRGAVDGILEATVAAMKELGATGIRAVVGPCIGPGSYEVGPDFRQEVVAAVLKRDFSEGVLAESEEGAEGAVARFFLSAAQPDRSRFDLPSFCMWRLKKAGVSQIENIAVDTLTDPRFFSYRRACLSGNPETGRQLSVIRPQGVAR